MDQAITRATGAAPRAVGEFQGYVDGVDGIKPSVRWLDRKNMPQVGDKLFVLPCGAAAGGRPARTWSILLTSGNRGLAAPVGHAFGTEGEKYERVQVMEIVEAGSPPAPGVDLGGLVRLNAADVLPGSVGASTVLTDERIEAIWCREAGEAEAGKRRIAFARAIEREVAAQAGQVAVPEDRQALVNEALSAARELGDREYAHAHSLGKGGPGVKAKVFAAEKRVLAAINALAAPAQAKPLPACSAEGAEDLPLCVGTCTKSGTCIERAARQPLIGKLLDQFSELPVLWGLNEPGALVRHGDVFKMLVAAGKAEQAQASTAGGRQEGGES